MAEQSLNDLLVAEFKEAFDQFDKVGIVRENVHSSQLNKVQAGWGSV